MNNLKYRGSNEKINVQRNWTENGRIDRSVPLSPTSSAESDTCRGTTNGIAQSAIDLDIQPLFDFSLSLSPPSVLRLRCCRGSISHPVATGRANLRKRIGLVLGSDPSCPALCLTPSRTCTTITLSFATDPSPRSSHFNLHFLG